MTLHTPPAPESSRTIAEPPRVAPWFEDQDVAWRRREERRRALAIGRRRAWWLIPALVALVAALAAPDDFMHTVASLPMLAFGGVCLLAAGLLSTAEKTRHAMAVETSRTLLDVPLDAEMWAVEVAIIQDGVVTGQDRGVLWLEGKGALGFNGEACSFLLTSEEIDASLRAEGSPVRGVRVADWDHFLAMRLPPDWDGWWRTVRLAIRTVSRDPVAGSFTSSRRSLDRRLKWLDSYRPKVSLRGQLPPLGLGPGGASARRLRAIAYAKGLFVLAWFGGFGALAAWSFVDFERKGGMFAFCALFASVPWLNVREPLRQARVLRRLEAEGRAREPDELRSGA